MPGDNENVADRDTVAQAAIALLLLTLKDLASGLVPLGFGVNRGYGDIEVRCVALAVEHPPPKDSWLAALDGIRLTPQNGRVELPKDKLAGLAEAWACCLAEQPSAVVDKSAEAHP